MTQAPDDGAVPNRQGGSPRSRITHFVPTTILVPLLVAAFITTSSSAGLLISGSSDPTEKGSRRLAGGGLVKRTELGKGQWAGIIVGIVILLLIVGVLLREFNRGMMMAVRGRQAQIDEARDQGL